MRPRLRSLELHGYKTFASRTIFEFPGAITAIVGPNGSGKSNIADAIRWVLGEQAYSLLRAKKTDDMIYLGSEFRPRSSMALASVVFDNDDSWLPIDFSEVALSRRAYRDGDNEYLLNGQRIRLKEINELLSQSGLAERTYTIIGQGSVDAALSLKPEERRKFFEEAAGIGLYRSRREESLNRLETTRRNLERVQDILGELEPRLTGLEKQARKVQEYERIKADLRLLLRDWYGYHWQESQNELAHTKEIVHVQEAQLNTAREHQVEIDRQINEIRSRVQVIRGELNTWHEESSGLHKQWEELNKNLAVLEEREKAIRQQIETSKSDQVHLEAEEQSLSVQIASLKKDLSSIQANLKEAKEQEVSALSAFDATRRKRNEKERELENSRKFMLESETRQIQISSRTEEFVHRLDSLKTSLESSAGIQEGIQQELDNAETEFLSQTEILNQEQRKQQTRFEEKDSLLQEKTRIESEVKTLHDRELSLHTSQAKLKAQVEVIAQSERNLGGYTEGSKTILEASAKGTIPGKMDTLTSRMRVKQQFEIAMAAVMGEMLEGILLEDSTSLETILSLLEQGEKGKAVLITKIAGGVFKDQEVLTDQVILSTGLNAFVADPEIHDVLRILLDQVYITRSRSDAIKIAQKIPTWGRVVTLRGEVFYGNGVVSAGQENRVNLLSRPREKQAVEKELEQIELTQRNLVEELGILNGDLEELQNMIKSIEDEIQGGEKLIQAQKSGWQQASLHKDQASQKLNLVKDQYRNYQSELQRINSEIDRQKEESSKNELELKQYRDETEATQELVKAITLDDLQLQLTHWTTQAAVVDQNYLQTQKRLNEKEEAIDALQRRTTGQAERLEELNSNLLSTQREMEDLHQRSRVLSERISELNQIIEPLEKETAEKEDEFNALQETQNAARTAVQIADRHTAQAQLDLSRQKDALESLRNKIEEDFGLVSFDYVPEIHGANPLPLEGMVEHLPSVKELPVGYEENIIRQKTQLRRIGPVNLEAQKEYMEVSERYTFLTGQVEDLNKADADLRQVIAELDELMKREFRKTFDAVAVEFKQIFTRLFNGGSARLELIDEDDPKTSGVDIEAKLPGTREQGLNLLSGGERSLTAVALIFALLKISPTPFCILDEVDAMLDEANVGRFCDLLKELSENTQFIIITHNRNTVQVADVIYGVTKAKDSTSQVISLRMDEITDEMVR
jgi:chromosome segregation protein